MSALHYWRALQGIVLRELFRFIHQRDRFVSALVRPLMWLFIFAAGFRSTLGVAIIPPYETYIPYEVYITPGLVGMVQLFNGMQSSLSMAFPSFVVSQQFAGVPLVVARSVARSRENRQAWAKSDVSKKIPD